MYLRLDLQYTVTSKLEIRRCVLVRRNRSSESHRSPRKYIPCRKARLNCGKEAVSSRMRCEACNTKFSFFKRKRRCMDCLRYFCSECVIKRHDQSVSCDSCSILSRRPVVRGQIAQIRPRDLRQYLVAKRICVKGCIEKDDLIGLLVAFANASTNGQDGHDFDRFGYTSGESSAYGSSQSYPTAYNNPHRYRNGDELPSEEAADRSASTASTAIETGSQGSPTIYSTEVREVADIEERSQSSSTTCNIVEVESELESDSESGDNSRNVAIEEVCGSESSSGPIDSGPEPQVEEVEEAEEAEEVEEEVPIDSSSEATCLGQPETLTQVHEIPEMQWTGLVNLADIHEISQLDFLNVKQLKYLLNSNRVDYKGCIERSELINKASRLWEEYKQSRTDVEKLEEGDLCKICWDAPIECVILECGHLACCISCGKQMSECPICKQYIVRVVRFFKA